MRGSSRLFDRLSSPLFPLLSCPLVLLFLSASPSSACSIPVFRYALEHWPADPYQAVVFHRGPLGPEDEAAIALLEQATANVAVRRVDVAQPQDEASRAWFQAQRQPQLPWLVVRYPAAAPLEADVWAGRLSADAVRALVDSPARQDIARRLLAGESAVWVLLQSGDRARDAAAEDLVRKELRGLQETLKLPEVDPEDQVSSGVRLPLRLSFALVRVSRHDPAERVLAGMLLSSEPDLAGRAEPMVFPVFGRGRVLYALVGAGINTGNLRRAAGFLTGACSCEVKRENPGVDLLLTADWDALAEAAPERPPARAVGETVPIPGAPAGAVTAPAADSRLTAETPSPGWGRHALLVAVLLAAGLVVLTGTWALRSRRPAPQGPPASAAEPARRAGDPPEPA
jgi:hypothetical protein